MVKYHIINDGIVIGNFKTKEYAEKALIKYVKNGYVKQTKESEEYGTIEKEI